MSEPDKHPGGRPCEYKPEFCDGVIELGRQGATRTEMAAEICGSYHTFQSWQENFPEFLQSVKRAEKLSQAWWERRGREATFGGVPGFSATSYIFSMKNMFPDDWRDKQERELSGTVGIRHEDALKELE